MALIRTRRRPVLASDERGVSAVEFALLAPVLMAIVMGAIEFSLILYTYNASGSAARDVARRIATNRLTSSSASSTVAQQMPAWAQSATTVTVTQTTPATPATNQITVNVNVPAQSASPTSFMSFAYSSLNLRSSVTMQQEVAP